MEYYRDEVNNDNNEIDNANNRINNNKTMGTKLFEKNRESTR